MSSNYENIISSNINYYKKVIIDSEIASSVSDRKGDFKGYLLNTKIGQLAAIKLDYINLSDDKINLCVIDTNNQNETIDTPFPENEKLYKTLNDVNLYLTTKLNISSNTSIDRLYIRTIANSFRKVLTYNNNEYKLYRHLYDYEQTDRNVSQDIRIQRLFGLNGKAQIVRFQSLSFILDSSNNIIKEEIRSPTEMEILNSKLVGKLWISSFGPYYKDLQKITIDNEGGNLASFVGTGGLRTWLEFYLSNIQINYLVVTQISIDGLSIVHLNNCPNLKGIEFYETGHKSRLNIENAPLLSYIGGFGSNFTPDYYLILKDLPLLGDVKMEDNFNSPLRTVSIKNCAILPAIGNTSFYIGTSVFDINGNATIEIDNCPLLAYINFKCNYPAEYYFDSIKITNTIWNYAVNISNRLFTKIPSVLSAFDIDVSNNNFTETNVDTILFDIVVNSNFAGVGNGKTINLGGNNAAPSVSGLGYISTLTTNGWIVVHN